MTSEVRNPLRTSTAESPKPELVPIGGRLGQIRGASGLGQKAFAQELGVPEKTYGRWERGVREISADGLAKLAARGWSLNWLINGEPPERLPGNDQVRDAVSGYASHQVSAAHLTIALEMADEKLARDNQWLPRADYAELVLLILQRLHEGWAYARIRALVDATMARLAQGEGGNAGRPEGVDGEGEGGSGPREAD